MSRDRNRMVVNISGLFGVCLEKNELGVVPAADAEAFHVSNNLRCVGRGEGMVSLQ